MVPRLFLSLLVAACGTGSPSADPAASATRGFEPPVATNAESPVRYPPALYERGLEGTVILRLFITDDGSVVADSTRVAESSGQAAFDSAAVHGVERMVFAPARRDGIPVATLFLQPVHFRHPEGTSGGGT